jgi:hypothetical protein
MRIEDCVGSTIVCPDCGRAGATVEPARDRLSDGPGPTTIATAWQWYAVRCACRAGGVKLIRKGTPVEVGAAAATVAIGTAIGRRVRCPRCGGTAAVEKAQDGRHPDDFRPVRELPWALVRCQGGSCAPKLYAGDHPVEVVP